MPSNATAKSILGQRKNFAKREEKIYHGIKTARKEIVN